MARSSTYCFQLQSIPMLYFPLSAAVFDCPYLQPKPCLYQVRAPQSAHTDEKENRFERYHGIFSCHQGCGAGTPISGPSSGSRHLKFLAPASTCFWLQLQTDLVHWKLKTIVLFVQLVCPTNYGCGTTSKFQAPAPFHHLKVFTSGSDSTHPKLLGLGPRVPVPHPWLPQIMN